MYESKRLRDRRRRRNRSIVWGLVAVAVAGGLSAVAFVAFGSDSHRPSACVIADVSISTDEARTRYTSEFERFATEIGEEGTGEVCLILTAAEPLTEGTPISAYVGPDPGDADKPQAIGQIEARVREAGDQLSRLLANPPVDQRGSALVEAATVAADVLEPGDRLLFLSDGLQWSRDVGHLQEMELTPTAIAALMRELDASGLLPDLDQTTAEFPFMLLHPGGLPGSEVDVVRVKDFWEAWAEESGADLILPGQF